MPDPALEAPPDPAGHGDSIFIHQPPVGWNFDQVQDRSLDILCLLFNYLILFDFIHKIISPLSI